MESVASGDPWTQQTVLPIGGLTEIGFVPGTTNLLVVGHQGRGLIDCATGERLARDGDEDASRWFDESRPAALGIGSAAGQWIDVWGLAGGESNTDTSDGWQATQDGSDVVLRGPSGEQRLSAGV